MDKQKKYINQSPVFYNREFELSETIQKAQGGFQSLQEHYKKIQKSSTKTFLDFVKKPLQEQKKQMEVDSMAVLIALVEIIEKVNHDKTIMSYILPLLDGILLDEKKYIKNVIKIIEDEPKDKNFISQLIQLLISGEYDIIVKEAIARVASMIISELDKKKFLNNMKDFVSQLINLSRSAQKSSQKFSEYILFSCLINVIKHEELADFFLEKDGIQLVLNFLNQGSNELQPMYNCFLILWLISYNQSSYKFFSDPSLGIIRLMAEAIHKISREKIIRVTFATFRNLCNNSAESVELMVDAGVLRIVDNQLKTNVKDTDVREDLEFVGQIMEKNLKILSSFEKYVKEINTKSLEWSPVHSEKFWKENVKKFEEQDFKLIQQLVELLNQSTKEKTVAIACYDLGEFCRFHPFGKNVVEKLNAKQTIMAKAKSETQLIRENALLALQKIMLHNWQAVTA